MVVWLQLEGGRLSVLVGSADVGHATGSLAGWQATLRYSSLGSAAQSRRGVHFPLLLLPGRSSAAAWSGNAVTGGSVDLMPQMGDCRRGRRLWAVRHRLLLHPQLTGPCWCA